MAIYTDDQGTVYISTFYNNLLLPSGKQGEFSNLGNRFGFYRLSLKLILFVQSLSIIINLLLYFRKEFDDIKNLDDIVYLRICFLVGISSVICFIFTIPWIYLKRESFSVAPNKLRRLTTVSILYHGVISGCFLNLFIVASIFAKLLNPTPSTIYIAMMSSLIFSFYQALLATPQK